MKFSEAKVGMRVEWKKPNKTLLGTIVHVDPITKSCNVLWDNDLIYRYSRLLEFISVVISQENVQTPTSAAIESKEDDSAHKLYTFLASPPEGCCPCGIPRVSGKCNYH